MSSISQPGQPEKSSPAAACSSSRIELPQTDGRTFELARRAPGVRVIIPDHRAAGKVLLTKEFRRELNGGTSRLPGGKVFDTLAEFETFRATGHRHHRARRHQSHR